MTLYRYGCQYRPPTFCTVPRGFVAVEEHPNFRHGCVLYNHPLKPEEVVAYELLLIPTAEDYQERVGILADAVPDPEQAIQLAEEDPAAFEVQVGHAWVTYPEGYPPMFLPASRRELAQRMLARLRQRSNHPA